MGLDSSDTNAGFHRGGFSNAMGCIRRTRRSHCISLLVFLIVVLGVIMRANWEKIQLHVPVELPFKSTHNSSISIHSINSDIFPTTSTTAASVPTTTSLTTVNSDSSQLRKKTPRFHLLIPATHSNPLLCKALLSSFILNYPTPTFINWNATFTDDEWGVKAHIAKIQGIHDILNNVKRVGDNDLILIVDGFDIFFQLPPDVMIKHYEALTARAKQELLKKYGYANANNTASGQRFNQTILFAADKICWPNPAISPACAAVPKSSLPTNVYGADTDADTKSFHNRPRFLNSGAVIGPARDLRDLYSAALKIVEKDETGAWSDQYILASIFGEQEIVRQRSMLTSTEQASRTSKWRILRSSKANTRDMPRDVFSNYTMEAGRRYEFSIGIDYTSTLFQTMTHAADQEIEFVTFSNSSRIKQLHKLRPRMLTELPPALQHSRPPFAIHGNSSLIPSNGNGINYADYPSSPGIHPPHRKLDILPELNTSWTDVPLASNLFAPSIPCLLHLNGNFKALMQEFWGHMWYHNYTRALLRQYLRKSLGEDSVRAAVWGSQNWWDERGGRGGAWTDDFQWMDWSEMCIAPGIGNDTKSNEDGKDGKGDQMTDWEVDIFGDDLGPWGKEKLEPDVGEGKIMNDWETLMNEKNADETKEDEWEGF